MSQFYQVDDFPFDQIRTPDGGFFATAAQAASATGLSDRHLWAIADHDGTITYGPATSWVNVYGYFATAEAHDGRTYYAEDPSQTAVCSECGIRCESGFIDDDGRCDECSPWD